ncbi:MAG: hypothetical protein ACFFBC_00280 [Promethearchaeota archaeon]
MSEYIFPILFWLSVWLLVFFVLFVVSMRRVIRLQKEMSILEKINIELVDRETQRRTKELENQKNDDTFQLILSVNGMAYDSNIVPRIYPTDEQKVFKVNEMISLKLEDNKTNIYVNGKRFVQCKFILLNLDKNDSSISDVDNIDDAVENYGFHVGKDYIIDPEVIFWAHCSNLQAWAENDYDTRILHSNISFPLLRRLAISGDPKAIKVLRDEILDRYYNGNETTRQFLMKEGFLSYLTPEQISDIIKIQLLSTRKISLYIELIDLDKDK